MKADSASQLRLLDLQALDTRLDQLAHRRRTLAEAAAATQIQQRIDALRDLLVAAETNAADIQRELDRAERDVQQVRERSAKDRALLDSGSIGNAKQLENLTHEVESLARRQSELEDVEIEVMERLEAAQAAVEALRAERTELEERLATTLAARDLAYGDIDAQASGVSDERGTVANELPAELVALYEKLRADQGGVGAAPLARGRCEGCSLELTASDKQRIRDSAIDEVVRCEECRRILVRTPESGI